MSHPNTFNFFIFQIREGILSKIPSRWRQGRQPQTEISLETKRGMTLVNTVYSNQIVENVSRTNNATDNV